MTLKKVHSTLSAGYAFIFDSAPLEYAARRKPCTTTTVDLFKKFGYGLAFPKNSPLTAIFTHEILKLREGSYFDEAHTKWFQAECDLEKGENGVNPPPPPKLNLWRSRFIVIWTFFLRACTIALLEPISSVTFRERNLPLCHSTVQV